jgi:hypothetical protein
MSSEMAVRLLAPRSLRNFLPRNIIIFNEKIDIQAQQDAPTQDKHYYFYISGTHFC